MTLAGANTQVRLRRLPSGPVTADDFEVAQGPMPAPEAGRVLTRTIYLSIDPVMRKRMLDVQEGRAASPVGEVMSGRTVGVVEHSGDPRFRTGDTVVGWAGWQQFASEDPERLQRVAGDGAGNPSAYLGVLGRPGITAWLGMVHTAEVGQGDTVAVSSAAGAVGSVAGQIARIRGARVLGIAGGAEKCAWLTDECGFDAAVDYKSKDFSGQLADATPDGITALFESVGGAVFDESLSRMAPEGRIALCGLLDGYQSAAPYPYRNFARLLDRGLTLKGFRIDALSDLHSAALADLRTWLASGALVQRETVTAGLEHAPRGFVDMLAGRGFGKHLIRVSEINGRTKE